MSTWQCQACQMPAFRLHLVGMLKAALYCAAVTGWMQVKPCPVSQIRCWIMSVLLTALVEACNPRNAHVLTDACGGRPVAVLDHVALLHEGERAQQQNFLPRNGACGHEIESKRTLSAGAARLGGARQALHRTSHRIRQLAAGNEPWCEAQSLCARLRGRRRLYEKRTV